MSIVVGYRMLCKLVPDQGRMHHFTPAQIPQLHSTHALVEPQLSIVALKLDGLIIHFNRSTMLSQQVKAAPYLQ